jgi:ribonuclease PH
MRTDGGQPNSLRPTSLTTESNPYAEGSCLIKNGLTEVLCTASVQEKVPQWLKGKRTGWVTAEYGMLPRATAERKDREATKVSKRDELQRFKDSSVALSVQSPI